MQKYILIVKKYLFKVFIGLVLGLIAGFFWYTSNYYHADQEALNVLENERVVEYKNYIEFKAESDIGLIFYPGAKVEAYAYLVLLKSLNDKDINVFLIKMPFNLAVFNINAADAIRKEYPTIQHWYIAGHSLGGAMASQHLEENADLYDGLIQLAAYPVNQSEENILILYGSKDKILDLTKIETDLSIEIQGGNHAYFGNYGEQAGDGSASISRKKQQEITIDAIINFIK